MTSNAGSGFTNVTLKEEIYVGSYAEMPGEITLRELNDEEAKKYIGGVVFVCILMIIGIIGNVHVLYVYTLKMKPSNLRVFILCMAFVDMLTSSVGMPFVLYDLTHPLMFFAPFVCKALRFLNYFNSSASALILVLVSVERYRKICVPLGKQLTKKSSKVCCGLVIIFALLVSWPAPVLYGQSTVPTNDVNITGSRCYTEDRFKDTPYQAYFNIFLILLFVITSLVLIVLYTLIGRQILRHNAFRNKFLTKIKKEEKFGKSDEVVDKEEKIYSKKSVTHTQISSETGSDTGTKSADVSSTSASEVQSTEKGIDDPKRHELEDTEATKDINEIHKYASEVHDSQLSREGEETTGFHSQNTDRTEVHLRPVEVETKSYFSIRKGSRNINDFPSDHGHGKCDVAVTEYETINNGIFPNKVLNNMNSNIYNTSSVLSTDDCMTSTAFQTTLGTSGVRYSQETEKASWDNSGPVLNGTKTVATDGGTMKT